MDGSYRYLSSLRSSWRIPAFALVVVATHLLVETMVQTGFSRFTLFLASSILSPLIICTMTGGRKLLRGAAINGANLIFSVSAFTMARGWHAIKSDLMAVLLVLAFSIACGACVGGFHDRLSRRFGSAA